MTVKQKSVLVTGASQGIGRGIALRLAQDGANLALVDIKADKLERVAREIEALGRKATTFVADVSNRDEVYAAVDHAEKALGGFDVMVNNAGIAQHLPHQCGWRRLGHPGRRQEVPEPRTQRQDHQRVLDRWS